MISLSLVLQSVFSTGTYGTVFKAKDLRTDEFVALKRVRLDEDDEVCHVIVNFRFKFLLLKCLKCIILGFC